MPLVGVNGEPLLERAAYVYDGTAWRPLLADAMGHLIAADLPLGKSLADGQLANAEADLYTVPAATIAAVDECWLFNTSAAVNQTVYLYVQRSGGVSRQVYQAVLGIKQAVCLALGPLSAGDKVRAYATTAATVNYELLGRET